MRNMIQNAGKKETKDIHFFKVKIMLLEKIKKKKKECKQTNNCQECSFYENHPNYPFGKICLIAYYEEMIKLGFFKGM